MSQQHNSQGEHQVCHLSLGLESSSYNPEVGKASTLACFGTLKGKHTFRLHFVPYASVQGFLSTANVNSG